LNNQAFQPRERDYAYAASFYAFSIWVGFGVFALIAFLEKWKNEKGKIAASILITLICIGLVPGIMAKENWNDHDRSHRYTALAFAKAYLDSCEPNAIFFTMGDNETFPLWYAQEVEGYRTDVRVCNLSLLNGSWYVDQMKRQAYQSAPLPISLEPEQYRDGTRDQIYMVEANNQFVDIKEIMDYIGKPEFDRKKTLLLLPPPENNSYRPDGRPYSVSFSISVDKEKVLANGTVRQEDVDLIVDRVTWNAKPKYNVIHRSHLILMDLLANFNWDRPIYFSKSSGPDAYFGLEDYFQLDGMAYRLVPIKTNSRRIDFEGKVNTTTLPDKLLNVFPNHARVDVVNNPGRKQKPVAPYLWGGFNDKRVYHPEETARMYGTMKSIYWRTATKLVEEGNIEKAEEILDKLNEIFNPDIIPYILIGNYNHSLFSILHIDAYLKLETPTATKKAEKMIGRMFDEFIETFDWFNSCDERSLSVQSVNIDLCERYLAHFISILSEEQHITFKNKLERLKLTKTLTYYASQIGGEIDNYIKKGGEAQQIFEKMKELVQLNEIADLVNDKILNDNITRILDSKINMISAKDLQSGKMFRDYFFPEKTEIVVND
jgi:hypothetical protein